MSSPDEPPFNRLDAERFAIECKRRGVPAEYWPDALAAAEELLNREDPDAR